jgi:hypothetical protein
MSREVALAELARRYLGAYAPVAIDDFATWSGLPLADARQAWKLIANETFEVEVESVSLWMLKAQRSSLEESLTFEEPIVRMLPRFDTYLLGYRGREFAIAPEFAKRINAGGGIVHAAVVVNGQVAGRWNARRQRNKLDVTVEPFGALSPETVAGMQAEVVDIARFLGTEAGLLLT